MSKSEKSESQMKTDKLCHYKNNEGTMAKDAKIPGQMYVPKVTANQSENFAGEKR